MAGIRRWHSRVCTRNLRNTYSSAAFRGFFSFRGFLVFRAGEDCQYTSAGLQRNPCTGG